MIKAILNGTKTQTRRIVKPQPESLDALWPSGECHVRWHDILDNPEYYAKCGYCKNGYPGDKLWVRETFTLGRVTKSDIDYTKFQKVRNGNQPAHYRADGLLNDRSHKWKPSIFMPRWASRITLEITGVRVERLNDISDADAKAEGVIVLPSAHIAASVVAGTVTAAQFEYYALWESLNGKGSWAQNPWVWIIEFRHL